VQEIGWACQRRHRPNVACGRFGRVAVAESGEMTRCSGQRGQVRARRMTPDADSLWIDLVVRRVSAQPADGRFDIVNLGRKDRLVPIVPIIPVALPGNYGS